MPERWTLARSRKRGSSRAEGVTTVRAEATASAMIPRETRSLTAATSSAEIPTEYDQDSGAVGVEHLDVSVLGPGDADDQLERAFQKRVR
jgi:hypothetical protein